jgi:hypothetical protein
MPEIGLAWDPVRPASATFPITLNRATEHWGTWCADDLHKGVLRESPQRGLRRGARAQVSITKKTLIDRNLYVSSASWLSSWSICSASSSAVAERTTPISVGSPRSMREASTRRVVARARRSRSSAFRRGPALRTYSRREVSCSVTSSSLSSLEMVSSSLVGLGYRIGASGGSLEAARSPTSRLLGQVML